MTGDLQELPWTKHVAPNAPATKPTRASKRPGLGMGASIAKLIDAANGDRRVHLARVAEGIAKQLDDDGAADEAKAVRYAASRSGRVMSPQQPGGNLMEWLPPCELNELVLDDATGTNLDRLLKELRSAPAFLSAGVDAPTRVLFSGPSGTGKTLAARWIGASLGLPVAMVRLDQVVASHLGETSANIAKAFAGASAVASILFLDEIDGMTSDRATEDATGGDRELGRATTALLQQLDLLEPDRVVIAATNHPGKLDAALRRRFASEVSFGLPDAAARRTMVERWLAKVDATSTALDALTALSEGLAGARVRALAMASARLAIMAGERLGEAHVRAAKEVA